MAIERMPVIALVPGVIAVESEVIQVPSEADAALLVEFEAVVFDRGLLAADLVLLRREWAGLETALDAALRRAADAEMDAATVKRARELLREHAHLAVALEHARRREPSLLRLCAGLAVLAVFVLVERLGLLARWLWRALCGRALYGRALYGRLRWDRWDRGNLSPLARMLLCVAFFAGAVLVWGR